MTIQNQRLFYLALLLLSSLCSGLLLTPLSIWIAKKLDIIDYPKKTGHKIHKVPTPRAGGIAILLSLVLIFTIFNLWQYPEILMISFPAILIFSFGIWDDKHGMEAPVKLVGQLAAVTILVFFDIRVKFLESQSFFIQIDSTLAFWLDTAITYIWVVGITNAMNMVDSMDGLAVGLCQTIGAFFFFVSLVSEQTSIVYLTAALTGVNTGVAFFNRRPARTFLGDSGAQTLGFILAAIAIIYQPDAPSQASTWFLPVLFFSVPIFDTTLVTISRLKRKLPFYKANLDHTYHRLVAFGWQKDRAIGAMHIAGFVFGFAAIAAIYLPPLIANLIFILWLGLFVFMIYSLEKNFSPIYPQIEKT